MSTTTTTKATTTKAKAPTSGAIDKRFRAIDVTDSKAIVALLSDAFGVEESGAITAFTLSVRADIMRGSIALDAFVKAGQHETGKDGSIVTPKPGDVATWATDTTWAKALNIGHKTFSNAVSMVTRLRDLGADSRTVAGDKVLSEILADWIRFATSEDDSEAKTSYPNYKLHAYQFARWVNRLADTDGWDIDRQTGVVLKATSDGTMVTPAKLAADSLATSEATTKASVVKLMAKGTMPDGTDVSAVVAVFKALDADKRKALASLLSEAARRNAKGVPTK